MPKEKRRRSSAAQRGKGAAKQCMVRRIGKRSKGERKREGCQKNVQNPKRSVAGYWDRESGYIDGDQKV